MAIFERVSGAAPDLPLPERKTKFSAGYDFVVSEDIIVYPHDALCEFMIEQAIQEEIPGSKIWDLEEIANFTKKWKTRPTLVPTGIKCKMDIDEYLELSVRSSSPLKHWLILANGIGIIDRDYYNNPDNEGQIYFQIINLSPFPIQLHKGDAIGQGIIKHYHVTEDDKASGVRLGGFGSTNA